MSARLVDRRALRFDGETYIEHRYSNGHLWVIVASGCTITARVIRPIGTDSPHHQLERG